MKRIVVLTICYIFILIMRGCINNKNKYNSMLYDDIKESVNEKFIETHITRGVYYKDIPYMDISYPKDYTIVIQSQEELNEIFDTVPFEINFEEQNVIIYVYSCDYVVPCKIVKMEKNNNECLFTIKEQTIPHTGSAVQPYVRILAITMDKVEI